ncbi:MAG: MFS transporter [Candidatus Aenigmatarchaeota archaeon]
MLKNNSKSIKLLALSALLNDLGSDAIKPFWPFFVTSIIGAPATILGILDGFGEAISYGIRWPAGWFSDKYKKRKILVWLGYLLAGISRIGYSISSNVSQLFLFKAMDRMGKLRDPPRDALLSSYINKKERGKAFGILTAADNFGAMLAPLFGLLVFSILSYRGLFFVAAFPSLVGSILILYFIKEKNKKLKNIKKVKVKLTGNFKRFVFSTIIFALSWISISFAILYSNEKGIDTIYTPFLLFVYSGGAVIGSYIFGKLSDNIGRKNSLFLSYLLHIITLFAFFSIYEISVSYFIFLILFAICGVVFGSITTLQSAFVIDLVKKERRAEASGIFSTFFGISSFFASSLAGLFWDLFSPQITFGIAGFFGFLGLILFSLLVK